MSVLICKLRKGLDPIEYEDCAKCEEYHSKYKRTNADRIRSMTDEELADELMEWFAVFNAVEWNREMIMKWLKEEVEE